MCQFSFLSLSLIKCTAVGSLPPPAFYHKNISGEKIISFCKKTLIRGVLLDRISKVPDLQCACFPSKLRAPGCPSCVVFPFRADARRWDQGVLPDALACSSHTTHVGDGKSSICVGRFVLEKRRALAVNRALGQLGRHSPCDPCTSS